MLMDKLEFFGKQEVSTSCFLTIKFHNEDKISTKRHSKLSFNQKVKFSLAMKEY
jgi:hypothetical protein